MPRIPAAELESSAACKALQRRITQTSIETRPGDRIGGLSEEAACSYRSVGRRAKSPGPCYVVEVGETRFLVDCGMHRGATRRRRSTSSPSPSTRGDRLRPAHPRPHRPLGQAAPAGASRASPAPSTPRRPPATWPRSCCSTPPTSRRWRPSGAPARPAGPGARAPEPLYTQDDARKTIRLLKPVDYAEPVAAGPRRDRGRSTTPGTSWARPSWSCDSRTRGRRSRCCSAATWASRTSPSSATRRSSSRPTT